MQKRSKLEVEGYLHDVSPLKEGGDRRKYFTALLQESERNTRVVVFDVNRHHVFESAEKDRTSVQLCDVVLSPSRQRRGEMDILVNTASSLRCVRQLQFAFDETIQDTVEDVTVEHILNEGREYQRVNITVKILELSEDREGVTRTKQKMVRRSYNVADKTSSISLTVWGGEGLQIGKWYRISNTSVRKFGGCVCLSTTSQSDVNVVGDVGGKVAEVKDNFKIVEGEIVTAEVKVKYLCPKHHPLVSVNLSTVLTRCQQCDAFCRTAKVVSLLLALVTIEESNGTMKNFELDDFIFRQLINVPKSGSDDPDVLVSKLLGNDNTKLRVKYRGQRVLTAAFVSNVDQSVASCSGEGQQASSSSTNMGTSSEVVSEELMLEEFFIDDASEVALNIELEDSGEKCVETQQMINREDIVVASGMNAEHAELVDIVQEKKGTGMMKVRKANRKK